MPSGVALAAAITEQQNTRLSSNEKCYWECNRHVSSKAEAETLGNENRQTNRAVKRSPPAISAPVFKKIRSSVQRTHSLKALPPALSSLPENSRVQKVTPTVLGIKEVARHLLKSKTRQRPYSMLALPTECTYEICSLVAWNKKESLNEAEDSFRENQLDQLKAASSSSNIHVYLQHDNVQQIDRLLEFPKKIYALKQNPGVRSSFNESQTIFRMLADQFWPGPALLYLSPQSYAPRNLVKKSCLEKGFVGFRCPSHPLTMKTLKQFNREAKEHFVLVGSPVQSMNSKLLTAKDVNEKYSDCFAMDDTSIQILQGEERKEIFAVPTCQFEEEWLECWIMAKERTIMLRGKSQRDVLGLIKQMLRNCKSKNRIKRSVLQHWRVLDERKN